MNRQRRKQNGEIRPVVPYLSGVPVLMPRGANSALPDRRPSPMLSTRPGEKSLSIAKNGLDMRAPKSFIEMCATKTL